jgi:two-component system NtrC family sensor kinase
MKSKTKRILVVEDEPVISHVCQKVLVKRGFSVDVAADGRKAIEKINERSYNLCILDLRLPGINGFQLYQYLTDTCPELSQNVIFTTGDTTSHQVFEFLNRAEKVYLEKPFTPGELIAAVEMALN